MTDQEIKDFISSHLSDVSFAVSNKVPDNLNNNTVVLTFQDLVRLIQLVQNGTIS